MHQTQKGVVPASRRVVKGYVSHADLPEGEALGKEFEIELLYGRSNVNDPELAHVLAYMLHYYRRIQRM